jgi:hypothetical protein
VQWEASKLRKCNASGNRNVTKILTRSLSFQRTTTICECACSMGPGTTRFSPHCFRTVSAAREGGPTLHRVRAVGSRRAVVLCVFSSQQTDTLIAIRRATIHCRTARTTTTSGAITGSSAILALRKAIVNHPSSGPLVPGYSNEGKVKYTRKRWFPSTIRGTETSSPANARPYISRPSLPFPTANTHQCRSLPTTNPTLQPPMFTRWHKKHSGARDTASRFS